MSIIGALGQAVDTASDRFGQLDGRFLLPALVLQLLTLVFRALAWRGVLVAAYPPVRREDPQLRSRVRELGHRQAPQVRCIPPSGEVRHRSCPA